LKTQGGQSGNCLFENIRDLSRPITANVRHAQLKHYRRVGLKVYYCCHRAPVGVIGSPDADARIDRSPFARAIERPAGKIRLADPQ
jgi:hypothetical protein